MQLRGAALVTVAVVLVLATGGYLALSSQAGGTRTSSGVTSETTCSVTGAGGFYFRVVSGPEGSPVTGETVNTQGNLGCPGPTQSTDNFTAAGGGWSFPAFPGGQAPAGVLDFNVTYGGASYEFTATVPPVGTNCATFHIPSGQVTTTLVMNGDGSYCP